MLSYQKKKKVGVCLDCNVTELFQTISGCQTSLLNDEGFSFYVQLLHQTNWGQSRLRTSSWLNIMMNKSLQTLYLCKPTKISTPYIPICASGFIRSSLQKLPPTTTEIKGETMRAFYLLETFIRGQYMLIDYAYRIHFQANFSLLW